MFVVPCFGFGGLEQVLLSIVRGLDRSRFNPSFCALLTPEPELFEQVKGLDMPCYVLDKGEGLNYSMPFRLGRVLAREKVHLVNSHDIGATLYAAPAARLARVRSVIHTDHSQILAKSKYLPVYGWILRNMVTRSIAVSQDLENYLTGTFGVRSDRIETIPNGIDVSRFSGQGEVEYLYGELGIARGEKVVGSVGRLMEQKGMEYLLRAFRLVHERTGDARLVIIGEGELKEDLVNLARELEIGERVVFAGIRRDIPALLRFFDVFALASLWEGQPISIMEAMAAGRPIVATDVGGNAEILEHGRNGRIVPSKDPEAMAASIASLLADPPLADELGRNAHEYAEKVLSSSAMVERYESAFGSVLAGGRP